MKKLFFISIGIVLSQLIMAQAVKQTLKDKRDTISYIIGSNIGHNLIDSYIDINPQMMMQGLTDAAKNIDTTYFSEKQKQLIMGDLQKELQQKQQEEMAKKAAENKKKGTDFLAENKKKSGVKELPSGLQYKVIKEGKGLKPIATDKVSVNYEGRLLDGKIFDSSYERGQPASFPLNQVIKGWTEGVQLMSVGSTYEFYIPSDLAYGDQGNQGIPPASALIFKVELLEIVKDAAVKEVPAK